MPLTTPTILLGFLLLWMWGISLWLLLTLEELALPDLECGVAPLGPPVPAQPPRQTRKVQKLVVAQILEIRIRSPK